MNLRKKIYVEQKLNNIEQFQNISTNNIVIFGQFLPKLEP